MINTLSQLLNMDLSGYNPDLVLTIAGCLLFVIVTFVYDLLFMVFGYIGGKRR